MAQESILDSNSINLLKEYLQIPSAQPDINYDTLEEWIRIQASSINLPVRSERPGRADKPVIIITWTGIMPDLPSVMLSSHMDVVPAEAAKWTHPPFAAEQTEDGNIYARGSQDMKTHGVQYLEALRRLRIKGFQPRRTVHVVFVPDEEIGGFDGMGAFVNSAAFAEMNVGFELDEGIPWPGEEFVVFNAERSNWRLEFVCHGTPGHSSFLMENSSIEKVRIILDHLMDYRGKERARIIHPIDQGRVTAINVTMIQGGFPNNNSVPAKISVIVDVRISPELDPEEFLQMVQDWCREAGDTDLLIHARGEATGVTELDEFNIWWKTFESVMDRMNQKILRAVCPGETDARFLRKQKIPALGVTLMNNTPLLVHDFDEFVNEKVFLRGISIYEELIRNLTMI